MSNLQGEDMTSPLLQEVTPAPCDLDQPKWIEQDVLFDLMFEVCNALYDSNFHKTSFQLELALDAFLLETDRGTPVSEDEVPHTRRSAPKRATKAPTRLKTGAARTGLSTLRSVPRRRLDKQKEEPDNIFADLWDDPSP